MCNIGKSRELITVQPREEPVPTLPPTFEPAAPRKPVREPAAA